MPAGPARAGPSSRSRRGSAATDTSRAEIFEDADIRRLLAAALAPDAGLAAFFLESQAR